MMRTLGTHRRPAGAPSRKPPPPRAPPSLPTLALTAGPTAGLIIASGRLLARDGRRDGTDARTHGRTDARTHGRTDARTHGRTDARTHGIVASILILLAGAGCEDEPIGRKTTPPERIPDTATVEASKLTEGFASGRLRKSRSVGAFKLAVLPVSIGEIRQCVASSGCSAPADDCTRGQDGPLAGPNASDDKAPADLPALCVGPAQAAEFCAWVGGRLPALGEWLLAVRGAEIRRFPWGDEHGSCEQHPSARPLDSPCPAEQAALVAVGKHAAGASPFGIQDVLLAPGELVGQDEESVFGACAAPNTGCVVSGFVPGAIESVEPLRRGSDLRRTPYAFRCAWSS
jgi:hypothetical protein